MGEPQKRCSSMPLEEKSRKRDSSAMSAERKDTNPTSAIKERENQTTKDQHLNSTLLNKMMKS